MGRPFARWAASPSFSAAAPATDPDVPRARIRRCRLPTWSPAFLDQRRRPHVRQIGLDVHREFCEVAISEVGRVRSAGVRTRRAELELFAQSLGSDDQVALESTGGAEAIARILRVHVARVMVVNAPAD